MLLALISSNIMHGQTYIYGAGVYISGPGKLTNCIISGNSGAGVIDAYGGGIAITGNGAVVSNCLIINNVIDYASGIFCNGNASVLNSNVVGNQTSRQSHLDPCIMVTTGTLTLTNSIVWGNKNKSTSAMSPFSDNITTTYCAIEGSPVYPGEGNIALSSVNTDATGPNFTDADFGTVIPLLGNTRLTANSPCIAAGNNALVPASLTVDLDGNPRVQYTVDMGAYESGYLFSGAGTLADPYKIYTVQHLADLATFVNAGNGALTAGKYYKLMADLDLQGWGDAAGWKPIGNNSSGNATSFQGTFDGNNHTIKNMTIARSTENYIGLFGRTVGATIQQLGIVNCTVSGNNLVGGLVGENYQSTLSNSYSTGSVSGSGYDVGGLVGFNNNSTISNSYSTSSVSGNSYVGGLVGYNYWQSTTSNSYSTGSVTGNWYVGGLVGFNGLSTIQNCVAANGSVIATQATTNINRIVGYNSGGACHNNYALSSMVVDNAGTIETRNDDADVNGTAQTLAELQSSSLFWGVAGNWYVNAGATPPVAAWSITPAAGAVWSIWDTKSYPYFVTQSAPVYNAQHTLSSLTFELRSAADSVLVYNTRTKAISKFETLTSGVKTQTITAQHGDTLSLTVYEKNKSVSYPVQTIASIFCAGDGLSAATAYQICDTTALANLARYVNAGNGAATAGKYYRLMADLDLQGWDTGDGKGWKPIGTWTADNSKSFQGTFDGNNHIIKNMTITRPTESYIGLFGRTVGATIQQLGIVNCTVSGKDYVGGLVGDNYSSTLSNSYSTGSVTGAWYIGGLVGYNYSSTLSNSYSTGSVNGNDIVGGLVGANRNSSTISNSYSTGSVSGNNRVGGLVGANWYSSTLSNSYSTGSVTGSGSYVGGLVGCSYSSSTISNCVAANASVIATQASTYINRIVGRDNNGYRANTYRNNYALSSMVVKSNGAVVSITDATNEAGTGKTLAELQNSSFYGATDATWYNNTAWSITPAAGAVWAIWDTKSYPYFATQSAPAYNAQHTLSSLTFELRSAASVSIYKNGTLLTTHSGTVGANTVSNTFVATDIILLEVNETGKAASYPVQSVLLDEITFGASTSFTYSGAGQTPTATAASARTGITWKYKTQGTGDNTYTTTAPVNVGSYTAQATLAADATYILATVDSVDFSIGKASLTVAAKAKTITYGTAPATVNLAGWYDITGYVNGEGAASLSANPAVSIDPGITAATAVGTYPGKVLVSGGSAANYTFSTYTPAALTIEQATGANYIDFPALPADLAYSNTPVNLSASHQLGKTLLFRPAAGSEAIVSVAKVGSQWQAVSLCAGTAAIEAYFEGDTDVAAETKTQSIAFAKATLTVTARNALRAYNTANPSVGNAYDYSAFVNATDEAKFTTAPTATISDVDYPLTKPVGNYAGAVTVSGGVHPSYNITYVAGALEIRNAVGAIVFPALNNRTYGDADFNLSATHVSGATVLFESKNTDVVEIIGTAGAQKAHILKAGQVEIRAYTESVANYDDAEALQTITVSKMPVAVRPDNVSRDYGQSNPAFTFSVSPVLAYGEQAAVLGAITFNCTANETAAVGTYPLTASGSAATDNYTITYNPGELTVLSVNTAIGSISVDGNTATGNNPYYAHTETSSVSVVVNAQDAKVTISAEPEVTEGTPVTVNNLDYGSNTIPLTVKAQNGSTQSYTLIVERYYDQVAYEYNDVPTINCNPAANGGYTFTVFQWYKDGVKIEGATQPYYQIKDNAVYYCMITLDNGTVFRSIDIQSAQLRSARSLVAYPNPTQGELTVSQGFTQSETLTEIQVFDLKGKLVLQPTENPFDMSALPKGVYLVKVNGETVKVVKK